MKTLKPDQRDRRAYMAMRRLDPAFQAKAKIWRRRCWERGGLVKRRARMALLKEIDPFKHKQFVIHTSVRGRLNAEALKEIWDRQQGLCALTGRPMSLDDAHLDHKVPRSRGGSNDMGNLRWTCSKANEAKGSMTDGEFVVLCSQVVEIIGRAIMRAEQ